VHHLSRFHESLQPYAPATSIPHSRRRRARRFSFRPEEQHIAPRGRVVSLLAGEAGRAPGHAGPPLSRRRARVPQGERAASWLMRRVMDRSAGECIPGAWGCMSEGRGRGLVVRGHRRWDGKVRCQIFEAEFGGREDRWEFLGDVAV